MAFILRDISLKQTRFIELLLEVLILQVQRSQVIVSGIRRLISTEQGEVAKEIVAEFNELWNSKYALSFDDFYENYKERYKIIKHQREIAKQEEITSIEKYKLQPNSMQVGFITNLEENTCSR